MHLGNNDYFQMSLIKFNTFKSIFQFPTNTFFIKINPCYDKYCTLVNILNVYNLIKTYPNESPQGVFSFLFY